MKKIYLIALTLFATSFAAQAQQEIVGKKTSVARPVVSRIQPLVRLDTLVPPSFGNCSDSITIYSYRRTATAFGSITGTNYLRIQEVIQKFNYTGPGYVIGALAYVTNVTDLNSPNKIVATYYDVAIDTNNFFPTVGYPVLASRQISDSVALADVPANNLTEFAFPGSIIASDSFCIGVQVANGRGDTSVVVSTYADCNSSRILAFRRNVATNPTPFISFAERFSTAGTVDFNFDLYIIPILDLDVLATAKQLSAAVSVMPVPARSEVFVTLPKNLAGANAYSLISMDGKLVAQGNTHGVSLRLQRGSLKAGVYILRISTVAGPVVKRVIFE